MKGRFREGDCFAIPLGGGGLGYGIVAAGTRNALTGFFFGGEPADPRPGAAIWRSRFYDDALHDARWRILRAAPRFDRRTWPAVEGEALQARWIEASLAAILRGEPPARPVTRVRDLRTPLSDLRGLREGTRLQWRSPLRNEELEALRHATASWENLSVRLYGAAGAQAVRLARWTNLDALALDATAVPANLPEFARVRRLAIDGAGRDLGAVLARFPSLDALAIDARGDRVDARALADAARLTALSLSGARLEASASLAHSGIRVLELRETSLDDAGALLALASLRALRLDAVPNLGSIEALRGHPSLEALALEAQTGLDDVSPVASLPRLTSLTLTGAWQLEVRDVAFLTAMPQLERLEIDIGGRRKNVEIYARRDVAYPRPFSDYSSSGARPDGFSLRNVDGGNGA